LGPGFREVTSQPASGVVADPDLVGEQEIARGLILRIDWLSGSLGIVRETSPAFPRIQGKSAVGTSFGPARNRKATERNVHSKRVPNFAFVVLSGDPRKVVIDTQAVPGNHTLQHDHFAGVLAMVDDSESEVK